MKKVTAVLLVLALLLSYAVPVMAQEDPPEAEDAYEVHVTVDMGVVIEEPVSRMYWWPDDIAYVVRDGQYFVSLQDVAENNGWSTKWVDELDTMLVYTDDSTFGVVVYTDNDANAFEEGGVIWVDIDLVSNIGIALMPPWRPDFDIDAERIDRLYSHIWAELLAAPPGDPMFTLDMDYGNIAAGYVYHLSQNLPMRTPFSYTELATAKWIVEELIAMGHSPANIAVEEFCYWEVNEYNLGMWGGGMSWWSAVSLLGEKPMDQLRLDRVSQNVVLTIPGQSQRTIIVGAHYDSPPDPGTSDNASGVGLLLESAKRMMEYDNYYTIVYVFFGAEETGLIGAAYHLHLMSEAERDNVVMMVNADVLIEGPVLIYGAAAQQTAENMSRADFIAHMETLLLGQIEQIVYSPWLEEEMRWMGVDTVEELIEFLTIQAEWQLATFEIMPDILFERQTQFMNLGWDINPVAEQVSEIAVSLAQEHDFEFRSIPRAVAMGTDSLVFLNAGFTVVNLSGMEYRDNISDEVAAQLWRLGEGFPEYGLTVTVLHTQFDCYYVLEEWWPGMIYDNMYAFVNFLNAILSGRFTG